MADPVPAGSDDSAGTYTCTSCGYELQVGSTKHLPPCPSCGNGEYDVQSGGDSVNDPYPNRQPAAVTARSWDHAGFPAGRSIAGRRCE